MRIILNTTLVLALAVPPSAVVAQSPVPQAFGNMEAGEELPQADWWKLFGDADLDRLIEATLRQNFDIAEAEARLKRARAGLGFAKGASLPSVGIEGSASASRLSRQDPEFGGQANSPGFDRNPERFSAGIGATWEIDLFGRLSARERAAANDAKAARQAVEGARLAVITEVSERYFLLRLFQERRAIAMRRSDLLDELARLSALRVERGVSPTAEFDRLSAEAQTARQGVPALDAAIEDQFARIDVLVGREVGAARRDLAATGWKALRYPVDLSATPASVLARRPDVQAALSDLAARNASVAAAERDRLPRFNLGGLLATVAGAINPLFGSAAFAAQGSAGVSYVAFDGGRSRAAVDAAKADVEGSMAQYQRTVLTALADVEAASSAKRSAEQRADLATGAQQRLENALKSVRLAQQQGAASLTDVLDVDRRLVDAREARLLAETDQALFSVRLVRALGGGDVSAMP
jgi:NodT family efflux transporter outer membrane factor (OMF) lipoprotein